MVKFSLGFELNDKFIVGSEYEAFNTISSFKQFLKYVVTFAFELNDKPIVESEHGAICMISLYLLEIIFQ